MKSKILSILLVSSMILAGCGNNNETKESQNSSSDTKVEENITEDSTDNEATKEAEKNDAKTQEVAKDTEDSDSETETEAKDNEAKDADVISGKVTQNFDLSKHPASESVRLWIPYAQSDEYQEISNEEIIVDENVATKSINEDELGNKMIYVEFKPEAKDKKVSYTFDVTRKEVLRPEIKAEEEFDSSDFEPYLRDSRLLNINGPVKNKAIEITEGKETVEEKVKAIYDWIFENMVRDNEVVGCGRGNVDELLDSKEGKCTDIGSMFVAMCRSIGIPAKETFGVRLSEDDTADITKSQHCWIEYYQPGTGWYAIDVADVLKACLNDNLDKESKEAQDIKDYYYGNLDAVRVGFTTGRDLKLSPEQASEELNQFGYPYAEIDGSPLDFYNPEEFVYEFTFDKAQ